MDALRDQLIAALMTAEDFIFEQAERIVREFEESVRAAEKGEDVTP